MSGRVWVIEQGEYSDYHVAGVFSSEENAKMFLSTMESNEYANPSISEWVLDPCIDDIRSGRKAFAVWMERDGSVNKVERDYADNYDWATDKPFVPGPFAVNYRPGVKQLRAYVWATDEAHAIKIAGERRRRLIADGEWEEQ